MEDHARMRGVKIRRASAFKAAVGPNIVLNFLRDFRVAMRVVRHIHHVGVICISQHLTDSSTSSGQCLEVTGNHG